MVMYNKITPSTPRGSRARDRGVVEKNIITINIIKNIGENRQHNCRGMYNVQDAPRLVCNQFQRKTMQAAKAVMKMATQLVTPDREAAPV